MTKHLLSLVLLTALSTNLYPVDQALASADTTISQEEQEVLSFFRSLEEHITLISELLAKAQASFEKRGLTTQLAKIQNLQKYIVDRIETIQNASLKLGALSMHKQSDRSATISEEELTKLHAGYTRYLDLFYQELEVLINLLMPLKDCDTMTQEEIDAILTV